MPKRRKSKSGKKIRAANAAKTIKRASASAKGASKRAAYATNKTMEKFMSKNNAQFDKLTKDAASFGKDQMEAAIKSGTILMKGLEDIMKTCMSIAQSSAEKNSSALKSLMTCKTLHDFTEAQNKLAQQSFDDMMSGATQISELSVKVCTDCLEPINDQMGKSIKKATQSVAA